MTTVNELIEFLSRFRDAKLTADVQADGIEFVYDLFTHRVIMQPSKATETFIVKSNNAFKS